MTFDKKYDDVNDTTSFIDKMISETSKPELINLKKKRKIVSLNTKRYYQ
jgi:hypothetical protein